MRESNPELHRQRVSKSLKGKIGDKSRRWKGQEAGYVAKHMWIIKHYGNANHCENNLEHKGIRFEWANISGKYLREKSDYKQLCPSCHRKMDMSILRPYCPKGHLYTPINTKFNCRGHRMCIICIKEKKCLV